MSSYYFVGILGLVLGLFAGAALFWEYTRNMSVRVRRRYGPLLATFAIVGVVEGFDLVRKLCTVEMGESPSLLLPSILLTISTVGIIGILFALQNQAGTPKSPFSRAQFPLTHLALWMVRLYVGCLFLFSGFVKINDYIGFSYKLEEYFVVFAEYTPAFMEGIWVFFAGLAEPLALLISVFEMALAAAILLGWRMPLTAWLALLLMIFFTFLTGFSAVTNQVTDCGCFGDALKLKPCESFAKDLVYMVMLLPLFLMRRSIKAVPTARIAGVIVTVLTVVCALYAWYCHEHLPRVDYRAYKVGTDLNVCTTEPGPDGIPKCKDFDEIYNVGETFPPLEGDVLMVVAYKVEKSDEAALRASAELAETLAADGVRTLGMTNTGPDQVTELRQRLGLPYPFSLRDGTMLKTIIRSNPGLVLLRDGVVLEKWHHNDLPSAEEVRRLLGK